MVLSLVDIGYSVVLSLLLLLTGTNGQSVEPAGSIRLPWEPQHPFQDPLGETIAIVDQSMVKVIPENVAFQEEKHENAINTESNLESTKQVSNTSLRKNDQTSTISVKSKDNINVNENSKTDSKIPIVVAARLNKNNILVKQNQRLDNLPGAMQKQSLTLNSGRQTDFANFTENEKNDLVKTDHNSLTSEAGMLKREETSLADLRQSGKIGHLEKKEPVKKKVLSVIQNKNINGFTVSIKRQKLMPISLHEKNSNRAGSTNNKSNMMKLANSNNENVPATINPNLKPSVNTESRLQENMNTDTDMSVKSVNSKQTSGLLQPISASERAFLSPDEQRVNIPNLMLHGVNNNLQSPMPLNSFSRPLNVVPDIPFKYNFSHSHASGHSTNFNVTWGDDGLKMHSSNGTFKQGKRTRHQTVNSDKGAINFSEKAEHGQSNEMNSHLHKKSDVIKLINANNISKFNTKSHSKHMLSDVLNSFARHNQTNRQLGSSITEVTKRNTAKPLVTQSHALRTSNTINIQAQTSNRNLENQHDNENNHMTRQPVRPKRKNFSFQSPHHVKLPIVKRMLGFQVDERSGDSNNLKSSQTLGMDIGNPGMNNANIFKTNRWSTKLPNAFNFSTMKKLTSGKNLFHSDWNTKLSRKDQKNANNFSTKWIKDSNPNLQNNKKNTNQNFRNFQSSWHNSWWSTS